MAVLVLFYYFRLSSYTAPAVHMYSEREKHARSYLSTH